MLEKIKNKRIDGISISNDKTYERKRLADMVPLDTPLGVDFHPSTFCNIKCIFCMHSSVNPCYDEIKNKFFNLELFKKTVDDMKKFPQKIKAIHFCGLGEPLMNKNIVQMIKYVKDAEIAEKIDMNSNGVLLSNAIVDEITDSGLDYIRISVNGLSDEDFMEYTGTSVNFEKYVENLTYLYENRKSVKIYIKILDFMVNTDDKKALFYKIFEPICDSINIENYNECFLDTKGKDKLKDSNLSQRGEILGSQKCCSQPFFKMEILPDGRVLPCAEARISLVVGDVNKNSIVDIWNSKTSNEFRLRMLQGLDAAGKVCSECTFIKLCNFSSDNIDSEIERLKKYYKTKI